MMIHQASPGFHPIICQMVSSLMIGVRVLVEKLMGLDLIIFRTL